MYILTNAILAILLFLIQNWIGSKSYSKGYIKFSLLDEKDEATSLNYVIKVFGPIIYLILCVAIFQYLSIQDYLLNMLNIIYYYILLRVIFIFLYERATIVNWFAIIIYYLSIIVVSNIVFFKFINSVDDILPNFSEVKNEIWLLIILFIYNIGNGAEERIPNNAISETSLAYLPEIKKRKGKYILKKFLKFKNTYQSILNKISNNDESFNLVILSILIYENFNRPRLIRWVERIWVRISKESTTQGIMQVPDNKPLTDIESVKKGAQYLFDKYSEYKEEKHSSHVFARTIKRHCPDRKYIRQILFISKYIIDNTSNPSIYLNIFSEIKSEFELYDFYD